MSSLIRRTVRRALGGASPINFPSSGFEVISSSQKLEEEIFEDFKTGRYYPVNIGEVFTSRYQVVSKLGFGSTSTVWLARDLRSCEHVALKVFTRDRAKDEEFAMYQYLRTCSTSHPGFRHVRSALDTFTISRSDGSAHSCIVQKPLWESFKDLLSRGIDNRFSEELLKAGLHRILLALDYLHTVCHVVHTDLKADNMLQGIEDLSILDDFEKCELQHPSPRKFINESPVYQSRRLKLPRQFGEPVLSDFGSAVCGDVNHTEDVQPNVYRCPEVMLKVPWSYPIDIWNLGCMIWDLFENKHLFHGRDVPGYDPNGDGYTTRAHLAEIVAMLGPPPADLLQRGQRRHDFFTEDGKWCAEIGIPEGCSLENSEENLEGENKRLFLNFVRSMLQWRPEDRKTAKELLEDPWLLSPTKS